MERFLVDEEEGEEGRVEGESLDVNSFGPTRLDGERKIKDGPLVLNGA